MLVVKNISEIATCQSKNNKPVVGGDFGDCGIVGKGTVVIDKKKIIAIGDFDELEKEYSFDEKDNIIDASGKIVLPGFVDCHTHSVFAGSRAEEYKLKLMGQSYSDLHNKKGGIHITVDATRMASEEELFVLAQKRIREMLIRGTTTVEIKSGYGLTLDDELKILRVIKKLKETERQDIVATFLGAHTVPQEYKEKRGDYVKKIIEEMLPKVKEENLAEYCDVFCDPLGFTVEEAESILVVAKKLGINPRMHVEQTKHYGGAFLAAKLGVASADHCDFVNEEDIVELKKNNIPVVFLPGVYFHLIEYASKQLDKVVEKIKKENVPVVLATDFNPGSSPVLSMKVIIDLAIRFLKLDYCECLNASTINAAYALDRGDILGSIEVGKQADLLVIDSPTVKDYLHMIGDKKIDYIIKKGEIIDTE